MTAKPNRPSPGSPPIAKAANTRPPTKRQKSGSHQRLRVHLSIAVCIEYLLYGLPKNRARAIARGSEGV